VQGTRSKLASREIYKEFEQVGVDSLYVFTKFC
jgi:hypothetical protein